MDAIGLAIATMLLIQRGMIVTGTIKAVKIITVAQLISVRMRAALIQISVKEIS